MLETQRSASGSARDEFVLFAGLLRLSLGQLTAAAEAFELLSEADGRHHYLALVGLAHEDAAAMRAELAKDWRTFGRWRSMNEVLLPRAGLFSAGANLIAQLRAKLMPPPFLWEREGKIDRAIHVLEAAGREKARTFPTTGPSGMFWMRVRAPLAELYRRTGRTREADEVERELAAVLAWADDDHPLRQRLKTGVETTR